MFTLRNFIDYGKVDSSDKNNYIENFIEVTDSLTLNAKDKTLITYLYVEHKVSLQDDLF